jgi:hypothetical protein
MPANVYLMTRPDSHFKAVVENINTFAYSGRSDIVAADSLSDIRMLHNACKYA